MKLLRLDVTYKLTITEEINIEKTDNYNTFSSVFSNG